MTTIVSVRRNNVVAVGGDGQVTLGQSTILKGNAIKVRIIPQPCHCWICRLYCRRIYLT